MKPLLLSRNIAAPREILWKHLSTPRGLSSWQADSVEGGLEERQFRLRWPELGARLDLEVEDIEEGHRLVLRTGDNLLDMSVGDGRISLAHHGLQPDDDLAGLASSWQTALSLLFIATTRHPNQSRAVRWLFRPIQGSAELTHYYFTDRTGLRSWLGNSKQSLRLGEPLHLSFGENDRLTGEVLSADRDVCLRVEQINNGALVFRTLPGPEGQRVVALGVSVWGGQPSRDFLQRMETTIERLARLVQSPSH